MFDKNNSPAKKTDLTTSSGIDVTTLTLEGCLTGDERYGVVLDFKEGVSARFAPTDEDVAIDLWRMNMRNADVDLDLLQRHLRAGRLGDPEILLPLGGDLDTLQQHMPRGKLGDPDILL